MDGKIIEEFSESKFILNFDSFFKDKDFKINLVFFSK